MLIFDTAGAPSLSTLLHQLTGETATLPEIEASPGRYVYFRSETWDLSVSVSNRHATSTLTPKLWETWSDTTGARLQIFRSAAAVTPQPLSQTEEQNARNANATGPPQRFHLSAAQTGPFGTVNDLSSWPRVLFTQLASPPRTRWTTRLSDPLAVAHAMNSLQNYLDFSASTPRFLKALYGMLRLIPGVSDAGFVTDGPAAPGSESPYRLPESHFA